MTENDRAAVTENVFQLVTSAANIQMPNYDPSKCTWKVYIQVFENKMKINDIDENKWSQFLLSFVGFDIVTLMTELCYPENVEEKTYQYIVNKIEEHLEPPPSEMAETYKFMQRVQLETETILEYVAALKKLAQKCNFRDYLDRALRDKFVHGLKNQSIIRKLFTEKNLTFTEAT